uniref:Amino_oxidase domain-containing protein n=1 Tax=Macrostomum lignano TaxID=282301 RepID=A0A1I8JP81_9PLAT
LRGSEISGDEDQHAGGSSSRGPADENQTSRLESAAFQLHLPHSELSDNEAEHFPDVSTGSAATRPAWLDAPLKQLTLAEAQKQLELTSDADKELCHLPLFDDTGVLIDSERDAVIEREFKIGQLSQHTQRHGDSQNRNRSSSRSFGWPKTLPQARDSASSGADAAAAASAAATPQTHFLQPVRSPFETARSFSGAAGIFNGSKRKAKSCRTAWTLWTPSRHLESTWARQTRTYSIGTRLILEFANAAPLDKLSLRHWDQDDENEFSGPHLTVESPQTAIPAPAPALAEGLNDLRLDTSVQRIEWDAEGATVTFKRTGEDPALNELTRVICTTTYRLACSTASHEGFGSGQPPLPEWKIDSINRLGYGVLNNLIYLGYVPNSVDGRGEFFLFWERLQGACAAALWLVASLRAHLKRRSHSVGRLSVLVQIFGLSANAPSTRCGHTALRLRPVQPRLLFLRWPSGLSGDDYDDMSRSGRSPSTSRTLADARTAGAAVAPPASPAAIRCRGTPTAQYPATCMALC